MNQQDPAELSDQELLDEGKKMKSASVINAFAIGLMIGVVIYSAVANTVGFLTLIPLYFIYRMTKGSKDNEALQKQLQKRNLG